MSLLNRFAMPARPVLIGAGWRAALVLAAAVAVALQAPAWARLPLSVAAAAAVATFLLRSDRGRGAIDGVLVLAGGGTVVVVLLGVVLNLLPLGLGTVGWALAIGVAELAVLAHVALGGARAGARAGRAPRRPLRIPISGLAWGTAVAAVLIGTVVYSTVSFRATHVAPLAIAAEPSGNGLDLTVTAGDAVGPLDLELLTAGGRRTLATSIEVAPDDAFTLRIAPPAERAVVQLVPRGSTEPVRRLILDDSGAAAGS